MFGLLRNKKGQSTAEYAILIGLVVAVAIAMQTYVKRGLQGRFKTEVDDMAAGTSELGPTKQYEPDYLKSEYTTATAKDTRVLTGTAKNPSRSHDESLTQSGKQELIAPGS